MEPNGIVMERAEVMTQAKVHRLSRAMLLLATGLLMVVMGDRRALTQVSRGIDPLEILNLQVKPNVIVVLDSSGSMNENLYTNPVWVSGDYERSKMFLAKKVLNAVVSENADNVNFLFGQYSQGATNFQDTLQGGSTYDRFYYTANSYDYPNMLDVEVAMNREPGTDSTATVTVGANDSIEFFERVDTSNRTYVVCSFAIPPASYLGDVDMSNLAIYIQARMTNPYPADVTCTKYGTSANNAQNSYQLDWDVANQRFWIRRSSGNDAFQLRWASGLNTAGAALGFSTNVPNTVTPTPPALGNATTFANTNWVGTTTTNPGTTYPGATKGILGTQSRGFEAWRDIRPAWNTFYFNEAGTNCSFTINTAPSPPGLYPRGADFAQQLQDKMNGAGGQPNPCGSLSPRNTYTVKYGYTTSRGSQFWFTRTAGGNSVTLQWGTQTTNSVRAAINASNGSSTFLDINLLSPGTNNCPASTTPGLLPNTYCTRENPLLRRFTANDPIGGRFFKLIETYDPDGTGPQPIQAVSHYFLRAGKFFNGEIFQVTGSGGLCAMRMGTVQTPPSLPQVTLEQMNTCGGVVENTVVFKWAGADFSGGGCGTFDSRVPLSNCSQAGSIQLAAIQPYLAGQDIFNADGSMTGYAEDNLGWFRPTTRPNNPSGSNVNGGIRATGNTPIAQSLIEIKNVFTGLWSTGQAAPPLTPISTHVDPKERTIVIFVTDGNDTCASGSSTADKALNAAYRAQLLYNRIDAAQVASSVTTYVVGFGSGADTSMLNQIAWGGSGLTWPVSGGQWTSPGPTQAYKDTNCPSCNDAYIAPSADKLKEVIDSIINQGATFGDYTAQGSLIQPIYEYVGEVPPSGGTTYDPLSSVTRYTGVVPLKFKTVFSMPDFQGHVYAINSDLTNRWDAGARLTSRVQQGMVNCADGAAGEATFANLTTGNPCLIDRRIYSTSRNGVFSVSAADLTDPTWVQNPTGNRIAIWPPVTSVDPPSGNGVLDAALGLPMTDDLAAWNELTTKYLACTGAGAPAGCSGADTTRVPTARKEARQIILAYAAGAKLSLDSTTGEPRRNNLAGALLFKARSWVLGESTLADSAIIGPPLDSIPDGVYSGEYKFFRDGIKAATGLPVDNLLSGFGLRNPDVDATGQDASATLVPVMSVIYVSANDMLHAFRAGSSITTTTQVTAGPPPTGCTASASVDCGGEELWGFVPFDQLSKLKDLMQPQARNNKTFVMASPVRFSDIFVPNPGTTSNPSGTLTFGGQRLAGVWRKLLIVGRGIAGKYYTALDVTAPGPFTTLATATQGPVVYWSRGNPDTDTGMPSGTAGTSLNHDNADYQAYLQMGETWSVPAIGYVNKVHSTRKPCTGGGTPGLPCTDQEGGGVEFLAFAGSGYSDVSTEGHTFFSLDALTGDVLAAADVGSRVPGPTGGYANALVANAVSYAPNQFQARQAGHPFDSTAKTSRVYIGDLHGRLWKFLASALTTPILFQDLGVDQPIGTPVALIKLPPTIPPDFSGDPHIFAVTGNDSRAAISTGQFRYYGFQDTGGDNDTTPPSNPASCTPTLELPCLFWGELTDSSDPTLGGFRGTVQPATVFEGEGAVPMRGRVFLVGTRFIPPPGTTSVPLWQLATPVPPYPCRSRFDSIVFALGATSGGAAYDLNATGDDRYVVFDNSRLVAASIVTDPRLPGGAQLFLDEGIYNPAVPEQPPPSPGPTPILGSSVRTGSSITGSTVCK